MRQTKLLTISAAALLIMIALVFMTPSASQAQPENLLPNPGFEAGYYHQDNITELAMPIGYRIHFIDDTPFANSEGDAHRPETVVWNINQAPDHERPLFWRDGIYNLKVFKGGSPMYSGMSVDVTLEAGARYRFTVPIFVDIVDSYSGGNKVAPADGTAGGIRLGVSNRGGIWRDSNTIDYGGWFNGDNTPGFYLNSKNYVFEFNAPSNDVTLWVDMFGRRAMRNNGFFLDGLTLHKIAEAVPPTAVPTNTPVWPTATPLPVGPWFTPTPAPQWNPTAVPGAGLPAQPAQPAQPVGQPIQQPVAQPVQGGGQPVAVAPSFGGPTSTPNAEGIIYAEVGAGDSVWSIAAKNGLTLDEIVSLNNYPADGNVFVSIGDLVIVGYADAPDEAAAAGGGGGGEASAESGEAASDGGGEAAADGGDDTAEAAAESGDDGNAEAAEAAEAAPVEVTPTPTAEPAGAEICLKAYVDTNQNALHDTGEPLRGDVAFTILNGDAVVSNYISDGQTESYCITGLETGAYRVTRSKAANEMLTTGGEMSISLTQGASVQVVFGSFDAEPAAEANVLANNVTDAAESDENAEAMADDAGESGAAVEAADAGSNPTNGIMIAVAVAAALLLVAILIIILSRRASR